MWEQAASRIFDTDCIICGGHGVGLVARTCLVCDPAHGAEIRAQVFAEHIREFQQAYTAMQIEAHMSRTGRPSIDKAERYRKALSELCLLPTEYEPFATWYQRQQRNKKK